MKWKFLTIDREQLVSIYLYAWLQNYSFSWNLEFINLIATVPYMANKRNEFHGVHTRTIYLYDYIHLFKNNLRRLKCSIRYSSPVPVNLTPRLASCIFIVRTKSIIISRALKVSVHAVLVNFDEIDRQSCLKWFWKNSCITCLMHSFITMIF